MAKSKRIFEQSLLKKEQETELEKLDEELRSELKTFGFLRECHLADASAVPKHESIEMTCNKGKITINALPDNCKTLYFYVNREKIDVFTEVIAGIDILYKDREMIKIESPKTGIEYDINTLSHTKDTILDGKHKFYLGNNVSNPGHFTRYNGSFINVIILKGGYVRIDLENLVCDSLSFRPSNLYENAFDVFVDSQTHPGHLFFENVKNGLTFYHPVLASALKHQAVLGPLDVLNGIYYAHCCFRYAPEDDFGQFVDNEKAHDVSSLKYNMDLLSC